MFKVSDLSIIYNSFCVSPNLKNCICALSMDYGAEDKRSLVQQFVF